MGLVADGQYSVAAMYRDGRGVPRDDSQAVWWFHRAAERGHVLAPFDLGLMYRDGRGVPRDYDEAARWFRRSAALGSEHARRALADLP